MQNTERVESLAAKIGATPEQVRDLLAFVNAERGTLTTTVRGIVTHEDGTRHWASTDCEHCS